MCNILSIFLGGEWRCIHIDDPRPPKFQLPPLRQCLDLKPSELIAGQLRLVGDPEAVAEDERKMPQLENLTDAQFYDMPLLEGDEDYREVMHFCCMIFSPS